MSRIIDYVSNLFQSFTAPSPEASTYIPTTAARLANGACSPSAFHSNHFNGIQRIPLPDPPSPKERESPVVVVPGKFSPPPYLFKELFNPFEMETRFFEKNSEKSSSSYSIEKKSSETTSSEKSEQCEYGAQAMLSEIDKWKIPPPSPLCSSASSKTSSSSGTRI